MSGRNQTLNHNHIMALCLEKARQRKGFTKTNPLVGAAVVKDGNVVSFGVHEFFGGPHAEVNALNAAGSEAKGADLYVTLEPCSTYGKTPPCTDKIISSGIKNVYIGVVDPNPVHQGRGIALLKDRGINVTVGIEAKKCGLLIEDFAKTVTYSMPYVFIKTAMSADGRIASKSGDSKWITSEQSRELVHKMRGSVGAVLTGIGTVTADNPLLTDRRKDASRQPLRVVLDSCCRTPCSSNLIASCKDVPLVIFVSEKAPADKLKLLSDYGAEIVLSPVHFGLIDINFVLKYLYEKGIMTVMVEAGAAVTGSFRDFDALDALELFIAPKFIGGLKSLSPIGGEGVSFVNQAREFVSMDAKKCGIDIHISARVKDYTAKILEDTYKFAERT
ncbi:MAG: bifunctional diaminohydroxyphosphoribosylaminopyrimidine deaminase/5-amino-6-(5-phosphoribosylamino)uracil reductase RibD [Deferribacterales bacterium]|nr:bifunctional diaminohydroxyphosphoribosylaminopyrimidine deaminase/5-amino-6-(5-phosphoribosylamino)uracil reductase RibD [Deferribacterales bacterium]